MRRTTPESFFAKLVQRGECWEWPGPLRKDGYVQTTCQGKHRFVHRIAYEFAYGPIPPGLSVCHKCDNRACARPDHLFVGTQFDNMADCVAKGRRTTIRGEAHYKARLTLEDVLEIRRAYKEDGVTQKELAVRFCVGQAHISSIVRGKAWPEANPIIEPCRSHMNTAKHARRQAEEMRAAGRKRVRHHAAEKPRVRGRFVRVGVGEVVG